VIVFATFPVRLTALDTSNLGSGKRSYVTPFESVATRGTLASYPVLYTRRGFPFKTDLISDH